ncbi:MAG: hypothetical protein WAN60_20600 [Candidatus Sulfotelmatobacter sp.]
MKRNSVVSLVVLWGMTLFAGVAYAKLQTTPRSPSKFLSSS